MTNYRKIYKQHYGPIPIDEDGRTYDIHHIDGNRKNDLPENLKAVTIQEHYDIHYSQGDWAACLRIAEKMKLGPEEISELATKSNLKRVANGTNPFLTRSDGTSIATDRVADGTHNFLGGDLQRKRVADGTHPFLGGKIQRKTNLRRVADGTHHLLGENNPNKNMLKVRCPYCPKIGGINLMKRYHFNNCRAKEVSSNK